MVCIFKYISFTNRNTSLNQSMGVFVDVDATERALPLFISDAGFSKGSSWYPSARYRSERHPSLDGCSLEANNWEGLRSSVAARFPSPRDCLIIQVNGSSFFIRALLEF